MATSFSNRRPAARRWANYSDDRLLALRFCDLKLNIDRTPLQAHVDRLYEELAARGLRFAPPVWYSNEWFSPDGTPGIAIPFFLAHPRLARLEKKQMLEVEGGNRRECMRLLRHEAGHAIDTAFRLHYKKGWRDCFGSFREKYPDYYRPRPNSRKHVLHLDGWYAQAHPAEDWAETFAVWLSPRSNWRVRYADWPVALRKLRYVDQVMQEIAGRAPAVRKRKPVDPVSELTQTLGDYYEEKHQRYDLGKRGTYDKGLRRVFSDQGEQSAVRFLRSNRAAIRDGVAQWTGAHHYTIDQVLGEMIDRCRELRLRVDSPAADARAQTMMFVTVHTMSNLYATRPEIPL